MKEGIKETTFTGIIEKLAEKSSDIGEIVSIGFPGLNFIVMTLRIMLSLQPLAGIVNMVISASMETNWKKKWHLYGRACANAIIFILYAISGIKLKFSLSDPQTITSVVEEEDARTANELVYNMFKAEDTEN